MSFTISTAKENSLEIRAVIETVAEWDKFCAALAKYRDKFEPVKTKPKEEWK